MDDAEVEKEYNLCWMAYVAATNVLKNEDDSNRRYNVVPSQRVVAFTCVMISQCLEQAHDPIGGAEVFVDHINRTLDVLDKERREATKQ